MDTSGRDQLGSGTSGTGRRENCEELQAGQPPGEGAQGMGLGSREKGVNQGNKPGSMGSGRGTGSGEHVLTPVFRLSVVSVSPPVAGQGEGECREFRVRGMTALVPW